MLIRTVLQFFGPQGEKLEELTIVDADTGLTPTAEQIKEEASQEEPITVYLGVIQIPVGINDSSGKMIDVRHQEIRFPIEASSRKEAFEKYEQCAQNVVAELKKQQEERIAKSRASEILVPNAAQADAINRMKLVTE